MTNLVELAQQRKRAATNLRARRAYAERRAAGLCGQAACGAPAVPGRARCEKHLGAVRAAVRVDIGVRRADGRCYRTGCRRSAAPLRASCVECIDKQRSYDQKRREKRTPSAPHAEALAT